MNANTRILRSRCSALLLALLAAAPVVAAEARDRSGTRSMTDAPGAFEAIDAAGTDLPAPLLAFAAKNLVPGPVLPVTTPPGSLGVRGFGFSLAFNGLFAVIGAPTEAPTQGAPTHGVAYVFQRTSSGWRFMQRLTPTGTGAGDSGTDSFGFSVDVYSDRNGSQIVVGAPGDDDDATGAVDAGSVYVYDLRRVGVGAGGPLLGWVARKLVPSATHPALIAGGQFGTAVRTENRLVVAGAPFPPPQGGQATSPGVVFATLCTLGASGSCGMGALIPNPNGVPGERYGAALALSRRFLVVGAPGRPAGSIAGAGAAMVYANNNGFAALEATLTAPDAAANDGFGASLALFRNEVLVGVASDDLPDGRGGSLANAGSARLFSRLPTAPTWSQRELFTAAVPAAGASFGIAVGLHARRAVIGSLRRSGGSAGGAAILEFERGRWVQRDEVFDVGGEPTEFYGFAVAAGPGGVFVGAPLDAGSSGRAYWYPLGAAAIARRPNPDNQPASDRYGASTAILGNFVLVGVPDQDYNIGSIVPIPISNGGEVRLLAKNLVVGAQGLVQVAQIRMPTSDAVSNARFGTRVALSRNGDVLAVSAPGATAGGVLNAGAIYVYERSGLNTYSLVARLLPPTPQAGSGFGTALDITPNGNVVLVGAPEQDGGRGMVYSFRRGAPLGKAAAPLAKGGDPFDGGSGVPPPGGGTVGDKWGSAVATDGDNAVVGSPGDNGGDGSVNVLDGDGSGGYQPGTTLDPPPDAVPGDQQGFGASVDVDDGVVAVGAPNTDAPPSPEQSGTQADVGTGYAYPVSPDPPAAPPQAGAPVELPPPTGSAGDKWGSDVGTAGGTVAVGAPGADVPTDSGTSIDQGAGATYACTGEAGTDGECPQTGVLFGSGAGAGEGVGTTVSIDENQNVVLGAPLADDGANVDAGAVYTAEQVFNPDTLLSDSFD